MHVTKVKDTLKGTELSTGGIHEINMPVNEDRHQKGFNIGNILLIFLIIITCCLGCNDDGGRPHDVTLTTNTASSSEDDLVFSRSAQTKQGGPRIMINDLSNNIHTAFNIVKKRHTPS